MARLPDRDHVRLRRERIDPLRRDVAVRDVRQALEHGSDPARGVRGAQPADAAVQARGPRLRRRCTRRLRPADPARRACSTSSSGSSSRSPGCSCTCRSGGAGSGVRWPRPRAGSCIRSERAWSDAAAAARFDSRRRNTVAQSAMTVLRSRTRLLRRRRRRHPRPLDRLPPREGAARARARLRRGHRRPRQVAGRARARPGSRAASSATTTSSRR